MQKIDEHISALNSKLQMLLKKYSNLKKENESLKKELHQSIDLQKTLIEKVNFLEMQSNILKASAGSMSQEEKNDFEKKINQYIKDIDKCISILNN